MNRVVPTSRGNILLRPALVDDGIQLRSLRLKALAEHPEAFGSDLDTALAEPDDSWSKRVSDHERNGTGLVAAAVIGEQVIGTATVARNTRVKVRHKADIVAVYVNPEWRGLHLAEGLIELCLGWARANGVIIAHLAVVSSNAPAIRCYARCGFTVYGIEPLALCIDGITHDEVLMAKRL